MSTRRRLLLSPLLLLVALATVLTAGTVSASAGHGPQTRVRAFDTTTANAVGQQSSETAGSVGCLRPAQPAIASGSCVATEAGSAGIETTAHGATRIAGEAATRGGVLSEAEVAIVREGGTVYTQSNGAIARVLQQADGRFSVVVDGDRGLITTFQNLSQSSLDRLAKNYDWKLP